MPPESAPLGQAPRPWGLSVAAAAAVGLPLIAAASTGRLALGALGALGALAILHVPVSASPVPVRRLVGCAIGVAISPVLGQLTTAWPSATWPLFGLLIAAIVAMTRTANLPSPGHTFFVLGACCGAAEGFHPSLMPFMLLMPAAGAAGAVVIGLVVRAAAMPRADPGGTAEPVGMPSRAVGFEAIVFGVFAMGALAVGQMLGIDRPYWVPISCIAVMRGMSLQAVWRRNLERIVGTLLGVCVTLLVIVAHPQPWTIVAVLMLLVLGIHRTLGQSYVITVLLATPACLLLTELTSTDQALDIHLLTTRVVDIVLGSVIGLIGGRVLHSRLRPR